jgi:DNA-binding beta-propeller fold protein YncE
MKTNLSKAKILGIGCLGIVGVIVLLAIFGAHIGGDSMPKSMQTTTNNLCFRQWSDLSDFNAQLLQANEKLMHGKNVQDLSDAQASNIGDLTVILAQKLKTQFIADGRLLDVPVGTEIKITKFYDDKGNETTPVRNEPQNTFYSPDGNLVYVAGEWNGTTIYTLLSDPHF